MTGLAPHCLRFGFLLSATIAVAAGCSQSEQVASIKGQVTYNGSPVGAGSVNFRSKSGVGVSSKIDATGTYKIDGPLSAGEYEVFITPPTPEPAPPGKAPEAPPKFEVPPKFQAPATSGVTVTVKAGKNEIPVEFKN